MSLVIALSITAALVQAPAGPGTASVSGQVLEDGSGIPVQDADVTLAPIQSRPLAGSPWERVEPLRIRTDREGRFHVRELAPGRYHIMVQKTGYALPFGPSPSSVVDLQAGKDHLANLSLQRGAAIVGRVLDEAGEPLANLRVMAMRQPPSGVPYAPPTSRPALVPAGSGGQTNDLGEFRLFGLPPGDYYVQASPGPEPGRSVSPRARMLVPTYFPDTTDLAAAQMINLAAGQTSDAVIIRVADAPAFQVSGVVVDENGRPVANAVVRLDSDPADGPTLWFGRFLQARTNGSGAFTISNVTSATYVLVAIAAQVTSSETDSRVAGGGSVVSFGSASSGGPVRHGVMSESRDGITTYYRDENATRVSISVTQADVSGLQVVVRLPQR